VSSAGPLNEELHCNICLDVFIDPVSTPCGHNFCKMCLKKCWDSRHDYSCPICKESFNQKPNLKVNTTLRDIVDHYKKKNNLKIPPVLCDICTDTKRKALKSCPKNTEKERTDSIELFTSLIRSIERCQSELLELMEQKQTAAETQAEELSKELEQEITELERRNTIYPSLCSPMDTEIWAGISINTCVSVETLRRTLTQLQKTLDEKLSQTVDVTLDPDTAHPDLILSEDGKKVRHGNIKQYCPDYDKRFNKYMIVLGNKGFSSGRFYFEVQVKGKTQWSLGVARESINRKGVLNLCPESGNWTLWQSNAKEYKACESSPVSLSLNVKLQKVGVFVDYEEGLVSFYDVESRSHIYSFTGQFFTDKLYPFLSPWTNDAGKNSAPLIISPVNYSE
uniref:Bloodthirsty-related gene family, member 9 n=1 Tax=Cyprinus carpio TaxID=7962 RepID=A0A8C2EBG2_CYPCA